MQEFLDKREWSFSFSYNADKVEYDPKLGNAQWKWKPNFERGKIQAIKFKYCAYKIKDLKGKNKVGVAKLEFLDEKYKVAKKVKDYNFNKFSNNAVSEEGESNSVVSSKKKKFDYTHVDFDTDENGDVDPVKYNSSSFFNDNNALSFNFGKAKKSSDE